MTDIFGDPIKTGDFVWFTNGNRREIAMGNVYKFSEYRHKWIKDQIVKKIHLTDVENEHSFALEAKYDGGPDHRFRIASPEDVARYQAILAQRELGD